MAILQVWVCVCVCLCEVLLPLLLECLVLRCLCWFIVQCNLNCDPLGLYLIYSNYVAAAAAPVVVVILLRSIYYSNERFHSVLCHQSTVAAAAVITQKALCSNYTHLCWHTHTLIHMYVLICMCMCKCHYKQISVSSMATDPSNPFSQEFN